MTVVRPPRRLSKEARREQLVAAAMPIVAEQGFGEFSLDEIADRADVTRNLLYHYFPRGRDDVILAVVGRACRELSEDWVVDESLPLSDRLTANFARTMGQALAPSVAWRVYRRARAAGQPEIDEIVAVYTEKVISSISLNHLGRSKPPALVHLALTGFVAFAEAALDEARITKAPRKRVMKLLSDTLSATIQAASS
ncbi:MAG TPA: TetR/AcrR family transcriptional regulator [Solirubrobacteraceae bacterium]|nr:TetR/AcrR family transcriptional regulator [Solirubrobacteraceae bacterium]